MWASRLLRSWSGKSAKLRSADRLKRHADSSAKGGPQMRRLPNSRWHDCLLCSCYVMSALDSADGSICIADEVVDESSNYVHM